LLKISTQSFDALGRERFKAFAPRVDGWLQQVSPGWSARPPALRLDLLDRLLLRADRAGMKVETDYALFALICINSGTDPEGFAERRDVDEVLAADWAAASKVMRLYEIAFNTPAAPS